MTYRRTLSYDPLRRSKTEWVHEDGKAIIATTQDISGALHYAQERAKDYRFGSMIGDTQKHARHVAEIPNNIFYELLLKFGRIRDNPKDWIRWLNDPANRKMRVNGERL